MTIGYVNVTPGLQEFADGPGRERR